MRILFLAPYVPWPVRTGDRLRSYALLRALAQRHEVTLSAPATPDEQGECFEGLKHLIAGFIPVPREMGGRARMPSSPGRLKRLGRFAWDLLKNPIPYVFRFVTDDYRSLIARHRPDFDAVFCRYLYMLPVAQDFPRRCIVADVDDLHYLGLTRQALNWGHGWGSFLLAAESARSYCYEQRSYRRLARVLVCSEADFSRIRCHRKSIVRNGIDLPDPARLQTPPRPKTIIFVGTMSYDPNAEGLRWFLSKVWLPLCRIVPEARLMVIGRYADSETLPFAHAPGVELVGEVEETASWISSAILSVVPLRFGLGTRIKIIESLACGRPVVSTRIGAEGLGEIDEQTGLFRVDSPRGMAEGIASLLAEPGRALALGARGRALVEAQYTWDVVTRDLASDIERWIPPEYRASAPSIVTRCGLPVTGPDSPPPALIADRHSGPRIN